MAYCQRVCRGAQLQAALGRLDPLIELETFDNLCKLATGESAKILAHARTMRITQQTRLKADVTYSRAAGSASAARIREDDDLLSQ